MNHAMKHEIQSERVRSTKLNITVRRTGEKILQCSYNQKVQNKDCKSKMKTEQDTIVFPD